MSNVDNVSHLLSYLLQGVTDQNRRHPGGEPPGTVRVPKGGAQQKEGVIGICFRFFSFLSL